MGVGILILLIRIFGRDIGNKLGSGHGWRMAYLGVARLRRSQPL